VHHKKIRNLLRMAGKLRGRAPIRQKSPELFMNRRIVSFGVLAAAHYSLCAIVTRSVIAGFKVLTSLNVSTRFG
jgi:hypothetical protein